MNFIRWMCQGGASMNMLEQKLYSKIKAALDREPPSNNWKPIKLPSLGISFNVPENWETKSLIGAVLLDKVFICKY